MKLVLLTALGVGGATVIGALIGFLFRKTSHKFLWNQRLMRLSSFSIQSSVEMTRKVSSVSRI